MPKPFTAKFRPDHEVPENPVQHDEGPVVNGEQPATPQKYALLPEETERLNAPGSPIPEEAQSNPEIRGCCSKYKNALKVLLLCRPARKDKRKLPSNKAGLISFLSLGWLTKLMWKAYRKGLESSDLWQLQDEDTAALSSARLQRLWSQEMAEASRQQVPPKLWKAVWRSARTRILVTIVISLFLNFLQFLGPSVLLKMTLDYIADPVINHAYGAYLVILVLVTNTLRASAFNFMAIIGTHTATRVTGGMQSLIYCKLLKLKMGGEKLSAQITNILTNDMERLFESIISAVFVTVSPVLFLLTAIYCIFLIGSWALAGLMCYLLFYPVMGGIAKMQSRIRVKTVKKTDTRVALMSEILNSLRLIKMYAWEDSFTKKISAIRYQELKRHKLGALLQATSSTTVPSISVLATMCTLLGYTLAGHPLSSADAFTIFSVFNALQFSVGVLPYTVRSIAEAKISLARIQKLLSLPEHQKQSCGLMNNNLALVIKGATFAWEIHSINLKEKSTEAQEFKSKKTKKKKRSEEGINGALLSAASEAEANGERLSQEKINSFPSSNDLQPPCPDGSMAKDGESGSNRSSPFREVVSDSGNVKVSKTLFGVNLSVEHKKLIGVCGSVGSGKSSLVAAICGDMQLCYGQLQVNGRLAIVTQQAWIYNATLKENILMGNPFEEDRYNMVIDACSLQCDINQLISGDLTEIGERGINLSGGQKQRVNLARAVYSDRDIYLLDDSLSAVDTKVSKHLFTRCIRGVLSQKTVILITHATHFLEKCDEVIFFKGGRICERGTHETLMERKGDYFELVGFSFAREEENMSPDELHLTIPTDVVIKKSNQTNEELKAGGKLIKEEAKTMGSVASRIYLKFMQVCGGWCVCSLLFLALLLFTGCRIFNSLWLEIWLDAGDGLKLEREQNATLYNLTLSEEELVGEITKNPDLWFYQLIYTLSFIAIIITGIGKGVGLTFRVLAGASNLHHNMFTGILRAPMQFIDATPTGRILNRFSRDMDEVDVRIPFFLEFVAQGLMSVISQILLVCFIYPAFVLPLVVIIGLFLWVDIFLNAGVRELKKLDNNLKSPVIQHLNSSISGLSVIRTFDREEIFLRRFNEVLDQHSVALLVFRLANRWFTYRMDIMGVTVIIIITLICVFTKGQNSTAIAGLALGTINGVCSFIPFLMRMKSEFVSRMTSVERIVEYAYELESEAPLKIPEADPDKFWPSAGALEFNNVQLRYRPDLPCVLRGITISIGSAEKIGIVGRTGAGKSSLISCLLRMVELDSGSIKIDGVDISKIGLQTLRSSISVIPQDPILFQGSIRYNLDPFEEYDDDAVWKALERSHLKITVGKLPLKLLSEVAAGGENFSVGEKQLICLARALLRQSKILLLDEATASVDNETDQLIQETIHEAFLDCTVLTIAHRLNTVASYTRILVLDSGMVKEFDTPLALMETEGSVFREMMGAMGVHTVEQLKSLS